MVSVSICAWCKHYKGKKECWKSYCEAFPDGIPTDFNAKENKKCTDNYQFEVNDHDKEEYELFFKRKKVNN